MTPTVKPDVMSACRGPRNTPLQQRLTQQVAQEPSVSAQRCRRQTKPEPSSGQPCHKLSMRMSAWPLGGEGSCCNVWLLGQCRSQHHYLLRPRKCCALLHTRRGAPSCASKVEKVASQRLCKVVHQFLPQGHACPSDPRAHSGGSQAAWPHQEALSPVICLQPLAAGQQHVGPVLPRQAAQPV